MTAPAVPFPRVLHEGAVGVDVVAVKRALSRAGYVRWGPFTATFGPFLLSAVKSFQKAHGVPQTGLYGSSTHQALVRSHAKEKPKEWAFDAYSVELMHQEAALLSVTPDQRVRQAIVAAGFFWYAHRDEVMYEEARPFALGKPPWVPSRWDCSAYATACHFAGGAPDPNGRGYDGEGYTGTLIDHGVRCVLADALPADLVFYGFTTRPSPAFPYGSPTHVALFVGYEGGVPMVLSNGHYPMEHLPLYSLPIGVNQVRHYHVA